MELYGKFEVETGRSEGGLRSQTAQGLRLRAQGLLLVPSGRALGERGLEAGHEP